MAKENIFGKMVKNMKENGEMGLSKEVEFGNREKAIAILDNGLMEKYKVMEFILLQTDKGMKDILKIFLNKEMENSPFLMEIIFKEIISLVNLMVKENMFGKIKLFMKGNLLRDIDMEKEL